MPNEDIVRILRVYTKNIKQNPQKYENKPNTIRTSQEFESECFIGILKKGDIITEDAIKEPIPEKLKCDTCDLDISTMRCCKYDWMPDTEIKFKHYKEYRYPIEWVTRKRLS